jgi:deoxyribonuclease V
VFHEVFHERAAPAIVASAWEGRVTAAHGPSWPVEAQELAELQLRLAARPCGTGLPPRTGSLSVGSAFVCGPKGASPARSRRAWCAAVCMHGRRVLAQSVCTGEAAAPYEPGLLALREGALLEAAIRRLSPTPDVLILNATGRDHPRRAGLALHLGAVMEIPTVGVTDRPLLASGSWPPEESGARTPLTVDGELVGYWLRTRRGARPVAVHAAWCTDPPTAVDVVFCSVRRARTPEPLRRARRLARLERARAHNGGG